jgi:site-specific recombinase XerD
MERGNTFNEGQRQFFWQTFRPRTLFATVTLEDAIDFCENLDELEVMSKRGEIKHLEDNSKRRMINSVKSFYTFAYTSGLFPANVMAAIKPPSAKSAISQRILPETTVLKMIILEQDPRNHAILHVLFGKAHGRAM